MLALRAIIAPESLAGSFVVLFGGGVLFYLFTSGTSYLYYCVWRRERFFPGWDPSTSEERKVRLQEWRWAFYNLLGNAVVTAPIHHARLPDRHPWSLSAGQQSPAGLGQPGRRPAHRTGDAQGWPGSIRPAPNGVAAPDLHAAHSRC